MRCTRCDGLAVPQAVGIAPDGKVVFGFCLECLADTECRLVEVPADGPWDLKLSFAMGKSAHRPPSGSYPSAAAIDQSQWIIAVVAFLMISWGLILLAAGLFIGPRPNWGASSAAHGFSPLLVFGGGATALLGLVLIVLATRRDWFPGIFMLSVLSWFSLL